jgi:hypothetical protein
MNDIIGNNRNIKVLGGVSTNRSLLSVNIHGKVNLSDTDDGSGHQKWNIALIPSHFSFPDDYIMYHIMISHEASGSTPGYLCSKPDGTEVDLWGYEAPEGRGVWNIRKISSNIPSYYHIEVLGGVSGGKTYLSCSEDGTTVDLWYEDDGSGRQRWQLLSDELWSLLPGLGVDIAASTNGSVYVLGNNANATGDFGVFKWNGTSWDGSMFGGGVRIAVDSDGEPWTVTSTGQIYQHRAGSWVLQPGLGENLGPGKDIGAGPNGSVWAIGANANDTGDYCAFKWNGASWDRVDGGGVRIAVDSDGQPWVVNSIGQIYQYRAGSWVLQPGLGKNLALGKDIGAGPNGSVWVIGTSQLNDTGNCGIFKWNGSSWDTVDGAAVQITVGSDGLPWMVNSSCQIYRLG